MTPLPLFVFIRPKIYPFSTGIDSLQINSLMLYRWGLLSTYAYNSDYQMVAIANLKQYQHKKVEQALGRSLRNLFEQLAWRIRQLRCGATIYDSAI